MLLHQWICFLKSRQQAKAFLMYLFFVENDTNTMLGREITNDPEFTIESIIPPVYKGERGKGYVTPNVDLGYSKAISSKSKYVEQLVKYIDWLYSEEGIETVTFGKEGETFERDANGNIVLTDNVKSPTKPEGKNDYETYYGLFKQEIYTVQTDYAMDAIVRGPLFKKAQKIMVENNCYDKLPPVINLSSEDKEEISNIVTQVNTLRDETIVKVITGEYSIDEVDDFLKKAKDLKIDKAVELYNEQYKKEYGR